MIIHTGASGLCMGEILRHNKGDIQENIADRPHNFLIELWRNSQRIIEVLYYLIYNSAL